MSSPGQPDHTALGVLAVISVPDASVPDGDSTLVAAFDGPELAAGTEYAAVVGRPDSNQIAVQLIEFPATCLGTASRADDAEDTVNSLALDVIVDVVVA